MTARKTAEEMVAAAHKDGALVYATPLGSDVVCAFTLPGRVTQLMEAYAAQETKALRGALREARDAVERGLTLEPNMPNRIVRGIETTVQIDSIRAARAKLRRVSAALEAGAPAADAMHDLWKAMSFLDDSFNTATMRIIREEGA